MKQIVVGDEVATYVAARLQRPINDTPHQAFAVLEEGRILGAVVFNTYTGFDIEVSVVGEPRAWTRAFIGRLAQYAFGQLGCLRVTFTTEQPAVMDLALRLGARPEGAKRNLFGPGRHGQLFGLLREDWKLTKW